MRRILLACFACLAPITLHAQWRLALLHGSANSHGDAQADIDPEHPELHAERPATWTFSLARGIGAWRIEVGMHRTSADLAEVGGTSRISTNGVLAAWGTGIELTRRVAGRAGSTALLAGAGVTIDRWTFDLVDASPRTRWAARGVLEVDLPITPKWGAVIRGELLFGPSVFQSAELPEGFSTRAATRLGLVLGVARSW